MISDRSVISAAVVLRCLVRQMGEHNRLEVAMMPKIKVGRYNTTGGTPSAPPVGEFYAGWIEPEDRSWILFIEADGSPLFYGTRDPLTGACLESDPNGVGIGAVPMPTLSIGQLARGQPRVDGVANDVLESAHAIGAPVHVIMPRDGTIDPDGSYLRGTVAAVTFTDHGKVLYDVRIQIDDGTEGNPHQVRSPWTTVVQRIESGFVWPPPPAS